MIDLRVRTRLRAADLEPRVGKVLGPADYDVLLTGPARVLMPSGRPLCVYLPGAVAQHTADPEVYEVLHGMRNIRTDNRGSAGGTPRLPTTGGRTKTRNVASATLGAVDPMGQRRYCRLTAWTGSNLPAWRTLHPMLRTIADHLATAVPDRYAAQAAAAARTDPDWVVPGTPFTTITVNNTYPTGMHTDRGDLDEGFSTIACLRRGPFTGGELIFPEYRVAVDLADGDLLLMDAHQWHANAALVCACGTRRRGRCRTCGAERISVVSYFRTGMTACGTAEQERLRAETATAAREMP